MNENKPNPEWVNAPLEAAGWIDGVPFLAGSQPPKEPEEGNVWVTLPDREPMVFKGGKWVPWLNAPIGWENSLTGCPPGVI